MHDFCASADFIIRDFCPNYWRVFDDALIDEAFDVADLGGGEGGAIEIEGEFVGADKRSLLGGLLGDDLVEGPVEKMGGGVVALDGVSAGGIYAQINRSARNRGIGSIKKMKESGTAFLGIAD